MIVDEIVKLAKVGQSVVKPDLKLIKDFFTWPEIKQASKNSISKKYRCHSRNILQIE